ncbi:MAG: lysophospholipid acyltransferase family protein [Pseudomonadota bacterium]
MLFLVMRSVMRAGGFDSARRIGAWLGAAHYALAGKTRRICLQGLAALQGRQVDDPQVVRTLRNAYRVNTIAILEVLSMVDRRLDADRLRALCRVDGLEHLQQSRKGSGAILLVTHSGNGLLLAAQLADQGLPITVVYRHSPMMSQQFFADGLPRYGIQGILANEGLRAYAGLMDALRHDRIVFAMIDQGVVEDETGIPLRFLGKDMPMPGGIVQLARQLRTPILPVEPLAADPVWHFAIQPRLQLPPGSSVEEDTLEILRHVEAQILAHPELWSWHQRRWREFPLAKGE